MDTKPVRCNISGSGSQIIHKKTDMHKKHGWLNGWAVAHQGEYHYQLIIISLRPPFHEYYLIGVTLTLPIFTKYVFGANCKDKEISAIFTTIYNRNLKENLIR
jgi:hypothetical protein